MMILRFLIYCLLLSTSIVLFAQEETYLFRKEFCDSLLSSCKGRDVCNTNGKNIIFGTVWNEVVDSIYLYARELDDQGNPLELKVLKKAILSGEWSTPYEIAIDGSRLEYHDNHYFMVYGHQYNPETDRWRIGVIKVNGDLETVWDQNYETDVFEAGTGIGFDSYGNIFVVGSRTNPDNELNTYNNIAKMYLMKLDSEGNKIWTKQYIDDIPEVMRTVAYSIIGTEDGGFLLSARGYYGWPQAENAMLVKIDSLGEVEWHKTYEGLFDDGSPDVIQLSSGSYQVSITHHMGIRLIQLNEDFEEKWDKIYDYEILPENELWGILPTNDGGFIARSKYKYTHPTTEEKWDQVALIKFDSLGNEEWAQPYIIHPEKQCYAWDFAQTEDGGYILTGHQNYPGPQLAWVMKTDALGNTCSSVGCDSLVYYTPVDAVGFTEPQMLEFCTLAGNPIEDGVARLLYSSVRSATWSLYDLQGQLLRQENLSSSEKLAQMDVGDLPKGLYLYRVEQGDKLLGEGKLLR